MTNRIKGHESYRRPTLPMPVGAAADTRMLLARLSIESELLHVGLATQVEGNRILLQRPDSRTVIEVTPEDGQSLTVHIKTFLGEVLLVDEAKSYLETFRANASPIEIELTEEGVLSLSWAKGFRGEVETEVVLAALRQLGEFIDSTLTVLKEDCYLKPVGCNPARLRTDGVR
jgi:hypothetical protein